MKRLSEKLEELVWMLRYGRPKRKISVESLMSNLEVIEKPVFFLSTGRCGTNWFSDLLELDHHVRVLHSPNPSFSIQNAYMHGLWRNQNIRIEDKLDFGENLYTAGREQHLRYHFKSNKRYIETNNHITFFAPVLSKIFPDALFVHLYRHPGEFVRSGIRRGWFDQNQDATSKFIQPTSTETAWVAYNQIQKIAWVWNETNLFIEEFKSSLNPDRCIDFNFNEKDKSSIEELIRFIQVEISYDQVESRLNQSVNQQRSGSFPKYGEWPQESKGQLKVICGDLANRYHYDL